MSYVETCDKHGQYHADFICRDCFDALQARVKDQAETIIAQKAVYETLSKKVKELESDRDEARSDAAFYIDRLRHLTMLDECEFGHVQFAEDCIERGHPERSWMAENARMRTALQEIVASAEQTDHRCYYQAVAKRALRELDF